MTTGIYQITGPNNKAYIGQSANVFTRWCQHRSDLRASRHTNQHLQNAWNKHGECQFMHSVLVVCEEKDLCLYEQICFDSTQFELYNMSPISGTTRGLKLTEEQAARRRTTFLGKKHSEESLELMRGRVFSQETKNKISAAKTGMKYNLSGEPPKQSADVRAAAAERIRERNKLPNKSWVSVELTCGLKFESISSFARACGYSQATPVLKRIYAGWTFDRIAIARKHELDKFVRVVDGLFDI